VSLLVQYEGFTAEVIDGQTESVEKRRGRIQKAVNKMAEGKKWVIVDGVGYAGVGSVAGVSNAEVASLLNAPVLVVGRPGIGNAIDSMNFILAYFEKFHVHTLGACWNKVRELRRHRSRTPLGALSAPHCADGTRVSCSLVPLCCVFPNVCQIPAMHSYHSYDKCKTYVNKYFREVKPGVISTYGHIPLVTMQTAGGAADAESAAGTPAGGAAAGPASAGSGSSPSPSSGVACRLRPARTDLELSPAEGKFIADFLLEIERCFDIEQFLGDLQRYYHQARVQLVSVV
jgi:hypothetical protein